jgi:hypothetical protein
VPEALTVVIGASDLLDALKDRIKDAGEVALFGDAEALRALDTINARRPRVVALERRFASTSRGAALINRIKADPALDGCEIRVIAHDSDYVRVTHRPTADPAPAPVPPPPPSPPSVHQPQAVAVQAAPAAPAVAPAAPAAPLDRRGTRRAPRFKIHDRVEVLIDGNSAMLIDLSVCGAQVLSQSVLRPNQRVRITLPDEVAPVRFNGTIAWAAFELPRTNPIPHYRAGIDFLDARASAVDAFCARHRRES